MEGVKITKLTELTDLAVLDDVAIIFRKELEKVVADLIERPLIENVRTIKLEFELNPKTEKATVKCAAKLPPKVTREWTFIAVFRQGLLFVDDDAPE